MRLCKLLLTSTKPHAATYIIHQLTIFDLASHDAEHTGIQTGYFVLEMASTYNLTPIRKGRISGRLTSQRVTKGSH